MSLLIVIVLLHVNTYREYEIIKWQITTFGAISDHILPYGLDPLDPVGTGPSNLTSYGSEYGTGKLQ